MIWRPYREICDVLRRISWGYWRMVEGTYDCCCSICGQEPCTMLYQHDNITIALCKCCIGIKQSVASVESTQTDAYAGVRTLREKLPLMRKHAMYAFTRMILCKQLHIGNLGLFNCLLCMESAGYMYNHSSMAKIYVCGKCADCANARIDRRVQQYWLCLSIFKLADINTALASMFIGIMRRKLLV